MHQYVIPIISMVCFLATLIATVVLELMGDGRSGVPGEIAAALQVSLGGVIGSGTTAITTRRTSKLKG